MKTTNATRAVLLAAGLLVSGASLVRAQAPPCRIGLALGGGGARGAAHIGVLKVVEELRIPVECIAGTSMGAVVGGLYAAGYTPAELEKIVSSIDWVGVFDDNPPRRQRSFRRKEDDFLYALGLEVGLKGGLTVPPGLISGRKLGFLLSTMTLPAAGIQDFEKLPIPFHAVAADVQTGESVEISKGNLARAIRASMAIPVVFSPVELEGRLLIDGGNVENLPVRALKEMGAKIIIASDVGSSGEIPTNKPTSATGILSRLVDIPLLQNTLASRKLADTVIIPDLKGIGTGDFVKAKDAIPRGETAARAHLAELQRLSVSEADYAAYRAAHRKPLEPPTTIRSVEIVPVSKLDSRRIQHFVRSKPGKLDFETLDKDMERLYGTGLFENVQFDLEGTGPERTLRIEPTPKSWGPTYARAGLNFASDLDGTSAFGILALIDATEMNRVGAQWKTAFELGTNTNINSTFYQPLGYGSDAFAAPHGTYEQRSVDIFDNTINQRIATYRVRKIRGGLDFGYDFGAVAEARVGAEWGKIKADLRTGQPEFPDLDETTGGITAKVRVDQLDNATIPKEGYFANLEWRGERTGLGASSNYDRLESSVLGSLTFGRLTVIPRGRWGDPLGTNVPFYDQFVLGGLFNLSGYAPNQLFGRSYGLVEALFYYKLSRGGAIIQSTYLGASAEAGNVWTDTPRTFDSLKGAGSVFIAAETLLGPFYFAYGYAGSQHKSFYVLLSRNF